MENIPNSDYQGNPGPQNNPSSQNNIVFTNSPSQPRGVNVKIVVISVVIILTLGFGLYLMSSALTQPDTVTTTPAPVNQHPFELMKKEDLREVQPSAINIPASEVLTCWNMEIPFPNEWGSLQKAESKNLDANGCLIDVQGCLCARKDEQGKSIILSILVTVPPAGVTLENLMENTPGTKTDIDESSFLGYPALRFVATNKNTVGHLNFLKGSQLFNISLSAENQTFGVLWPDFLAKTQAIKFK